jgi:hypothetical protein
MFATDELKLSSVEHFTPGGSVKHATYCVKIVDNICIEDYFLPNNACNVRIYFQRDTTLITYAFILSSTACFGQFRYYQVYFTTHMEEKHRGGSLPFTINSQKYTTCDHYSLQLYNEIKTIVLELVKNLNIT